MNRRSFIQNISFSASALLSDRFAFASTENTDVIVIGAGISGLYAAHLLQEKGLTVRILEASQRVGGRMFTLDDIPWKPNTGGTEIGDGYKKIIGLAEKVGIKMIEPVQERGGTSMFVIGGQAVLDKDWVSSPLNKLADSEKKFSPAMLESMLMNGKNPMQTLDDWYDPKYTTYDIPFSEFLRKNGASDEAIRLINANANTNDIATTSTLNILKSMTFRTKGGSKKTLRIEGGSQRLPEAVSKLLKNPVEYNKKVSEVEDQGGRVRVKCSDGSTYIAKKAIVTVPFSALKAVKFKGGLSEFFYDAIRKLQYTQITQLHVAVKESFWETDGLPMNMWTDGAFGRVFLNKGDNGQIGLLAWVNGLEALALDKFSEKEAITAFYAEMKKLRPASEGKLEVLKVNSWGNNPFACGAYYHLAPGQASKYYPQMTEPSGRVYFAGEHTALQNNGMEAACESAERVVGQILT